MNNTYFLKRQEIGDGYNHTGPKTGQQQEDQKETDRKNHQNFYMDFKWIKKCTCKNETMTVLKENLGKLFYSPEVEKDFLSMIPK